MQGTPPPSFLLERPEPDSVSKQNHPGERLSKESFALGVLTANSGTLPHYGYWGSSVLRATRTLHGTKPVTLRVSIPEDYPYATLPHCRPQGVGGSRKGFLGVLANPLPDASGPARYSGA
jgi:hypothetical protein